MKRLHIVGTSKDSKRLFLAKTRGAKFGSFEVPISQKLLKLVHEAEAARNSQRKKGTAQPTEPSAPTGAEDRPPAPGAEDAATVGPSDAGIDLPVGTRGPLERQETGGPERRAGVPQRGAAGGERGDRAAGGGRDGDRSGPQQEEDGGGAEESRPAVGGLPSQRHRDQLRGRVQSRRKRPPIPARSALTPAEIQTLVRSGRSIRSVAQLAGTSTAWVRWLAEPVEQERMGIVRQALQQRQRRARLGAAAAPLGEAVVRNLRSRGMAAPERIVEDGFSASRDGREWRVRLSYEHRGRRMNAIWSFDAQTREVVPLNNLATQLGWAEPPGEGGAAEERDGSTSRRPRRKSAPAKGRKTAARRSGAARKTTSKRPVRRTSASGTRAPKRAAAARSSRKSGSGSTRATVRTSASKRRRRS